MLSFFSAIAELKVSYYTFMLFRRFYDVNNFLDFLFAPLDAQAFQYRASFKGMTLLLEGQFCLLEIDLHCKRDAKKENE